MENDIFIRPAVASQLDQGFIEARLHVDIQSSLTAEQFADNRRRQAELVDTLAMPTFVIVDPTTDEVLGVTGLSGGPSEWQDLFTNFLAAHSRP